MTITIRYLPVIVVCVSTLFFNACRSRQQTDNQPTDSTVNATGTVVSAEVPIMGHLAELGLTNDSDWRGINLGDDFATIKTAEKGEAFERDARHVGYTVEFKNLETADILYYQQNQKVASIDIDLFLNSRQSVRDYQKELTAYFTSRYGAPKPGASNTVWTSSGKKAVTLKDVSKGKDFGLKIKLELASSVTTASAK